VTAIAEKLQLQTGGSYLPLKLRMRKLLVFALYFVRLSLLGPHPGSRLTVEPMIISRLPHAAAQRHRCIIEQDTKSAQQNQFSSPSFLLHTWKNRIKKLSLSLHPPPRNQKQQQQTQNQKKKKQTQPTSV